MGGWDVPLNAVVLKRDGIRVAVIGEQGAGHVDLEAVGGWVGGWLGRREGNEEEDAMNG